MNKDHLHKVFEKWDEELIIAPIAECHEDLFLARLKRERQYIMRRSVLRWAAVALLIISLGGGLNLLQPNAHPEVIEFQHAETYLTNLIQEQVNHLNTIDLPGSNKLIQHSKVQLNRLKKDYTELYQSWEDNQNQPQFINALITNLRTQLDLLEEIQKQLTLLKQENYERI